MRSLKKCSTVLSHGNGLERRVQRVVASFGGDNEGGVASVLGLDEQRGEAYMRGGMYSSGGPLKARTRIVLP